ncbi:hypothetical protein [Nocardia sp. NPDC058497]|uniref:hypothetical protein n=1 Tax=Nocardia sp. NPDC058497 TaxID=3346529 RepID=UPI0036674D34
MIPVTETRAMPPSRSAALVAPAPLRPAPDFGPLDTARGWAVTAVLAGSAARTPRPSR